MAAHGITFDHAFSNAPVCSVARSTLATGCLGPRIGTQFHRKHTIATLPQGLRMFSELLRTPATTHQTIPKRTTTQRPRKKRGTNLREQRVGENGGVQTNPSSTWSRTLSHTKVRCTLARKFSRTRRQPPIQLPSNWRTTSRTLQNFATRMPGITTAWQ